MKINYSKMYRALKNGDKLPRKIKKKYGWLQLGKQVIAQSMTWTPRSDTPKKFRDRP